MSLNINNIYNKLYESIKSLKEGSFVFKIYNINALNAAYNGIQDTIKLIINDIDNNINLKKLNLDTDYDHDIMFILDIIESINVFDNINCKIFILTNKNWYLSMLNNLIIIINKNNIENTLNILIYSIKK